MRKIAWLIVFLLPLLGNAQDVTLFSSLDTSTIRIGEQTYLRLQLRDLKKGADVTWPEVKDTLSRYIEVVDPGYPEGVSASGDMSMVMKISITSWDTGHYVIKPLKVIVNGKVLYSEPFLLHVGTIEVDTTKAPLDIKPILEEPFSLSAWLSANWPFVVAALAILAILFFIFKMRRTGRGTIIPIAAAPVEDPIDSILVRLNRMRDDKSWAQGTIKDYYVELTDKIRDYLELRYGVNAHEYTSAEIMESIRYKGMNPAYVEQLSGLLRTADMVKFAKENPSEIVASSHLNESISFIQNSRMQDPETNKE
jgi:hypothetical protein